MPEEMNSPENRKLTPGESTESERLSGQMSFEEKIRSLTESSGKSKKSEVTSQPLLLLAKEVLRPWNQSAEKLEHLLEKGSECYAEGGVPDEEWSKLGGVIWEESRRLREEMGPSGIERTLHRTTETMGRVAEVQDRVARGERGLVDLPPKSDKEAQRKYARAVLDHIENSNRDCHDFAINQTVVSLETSLGQGEIHPDIEKEVRARLAVHDCSELMRQTGGWIERDYSRVGPGFSIGGAATEAQRRGHELTREVIKAFLDEDSLDKRIMPGLRVAEAWDEIQKACFEYRKDYVVQAKRFLEEQGKNPRFPVADDKLKELNDDEVRQGRVETNFWVDSDGERKAAVREFIIHRLGGDYSARKSFQLAEKLAVATLETSIFNRTAMAGNDELAEIIGLKGWRAGRARTGRKRGPEIHELEIDGFGSSWLRQPQWCKRFLLEVKTRRGKIYLVGKNENDEFYKEAESLLREYRKSKGRVKQRTVGEGIKISLEKEENRIRIVREVTVDEPVYAKDIDTDKIPEGSHVYFCTVMLIRYQLLRKLLLDRAPIPWPKEGHIDKTFLQNAVVYFDTADRPEKGKKCGPKKLRVLWLLGAVDMALADMDLGWDGKSFGELEKMATRESLSPEAGPFITPNQWQWIRESTNLKKRILSFGFRRGIATFVDKAFSGR